METDRVAVFLIGGSLAVIAVGDLLLACRRRRLVTDVLRSHRLAFAMFVLLISAHVFDVCGRFDPFKLIGRCAQ